MLPAIGKIILGVLSLLPLTFLAAFFFWLVPAFFAPWPEGSEKSLFAQRFELLYPIAVSTSAVLVTLTIVYGLILARRSDVSIGEKVAVPLAILVSNGILLPAVFWLYVWRGSSLAGLSRKPAV